METTALGEVLLSLVSEVYGYDPAEITLDSVIGSDIDLLTNPEEFSKLVGLINQKLDLELKPSDLTPVLEEDEPTLRMITFLIEDALLG